MLQLASKNLLVLGMGKSGSSVASRASNLGAKVWVYDEKISADNFKGFSRFEHPSHASGLSPLDFDLVVTSPGIPFDHPVHRLAAQKKWPVISEIEFAYLFLEPKFIIGITGTNGKTTVVEMLSHVFKLSGKTHTVAGNIGTPLSSFSKIEDTLILELSSFQLHFIDQFRANIGVLLNVEQDHLDWHCCFGQYLKDKLRLFENQKNGDVAIIGDSVLINRVETVSEDKKVVLYSTMTQADYAFKDGYLLANGEKIVAAKDMKLKGLHNIANTLAVMACAREAGIETRFIKEGIESFEGLKHRLQFVAEKNGVQFFNDSKATNPDSTRKAIEAFSSPLILIMGGRNKGNDFSFIKEYLNSSIKELVLYGEAADEIKTQAGTGHTAQTVEEALTKALHLAKSDNIILFSPGCASFDLFESYAKRGDAFMKAVQKLEVPPRTGQARGRDLPAGRQGREIDG